MDEEEEEFKRKVDDPLHHMSQQDVADALGLPRSTVSKIERTALAKIRRQLRGHKREDYYD